MSMSDTKMALLAKMVIVHAKIMETEEAMENARLNSEYASLKAVLESQESSESEGESDSELGTTSEDEDPTTSDEDAITESSGSEASSSEEEEEAQFTSESEDDMEDTNTTGNNPKCCNPRCDSPIGEFGGNNSAPLWGDGRCCNACNDEVIHARIFGSS